MVEIHPYLGKIPILRNIFQMGWNHQLGNPLLAGYSIMIHLDLAPGSGQTQRQRPASHAAQARQRAPEEWGRGFPGVMTGEKMTWDGAKTL